MKEKMEQIKRESVREKWNAKFGLKIDLGIMGLDKQEKTNLAGSGMSLQWIVYLWQIP